MFTTRVACAAVGAVALLMLGSGAAVEAAEKGRTVGGKVVQYSDWRDRKPHEAMINVIDLEKFPPLEEVTVQQRTRDNAMTRQRIRFDRRQAAIFVDHFAVGYFNLRATDDMHSKSTTKKRVKEWFVMSHERDEVSFEESRKVYRYGRRGGWVHAARVGSRSSLCIFGMMGFLTTGKSVPSENYDTIIAIRDCSGDRTIRDYESFFKSVKLVPPEYNR